MSQKVFDILGDSNNLYKSQFEESQRLVEKWGKTGLLDGLDNTYEKAGTATLLENQARQLIDEVSATGGRNQEEWSGVALPLVRRIFAEIAAKEFVSVQPMNLPSGLVFYLDFKYGTDQPGFTTGAGATSQADTLHGTTNTTGEASDGLYGAGRFGYSINDTALTDLTATVASASWSDVRFDPDLSASLGDLQVVNITRAQLPALDPEGVRAFEVDNGAPSTIATYYPAYTTIDATNVSFVVSQSGDLSTVLATFSASYHQQPTASNRGDFEYTGTDLDIPEINVSLRQEPIVAKTRKLKAVWTPEFAQDLNAYHSIDAENELTSILSEYISMEIDLEILDMLIINAVTTDTWSASVGTSKNSATDPYFGAQDISLSGASLAYTQNAWFQTLGTKVQKVSNKIHQKTMRGGANFIVVSPDIATVIESIPGYAGDTDGNQAQFAMGVQKVGMLNNRFQVYKNPYMKENLMLLGFRGTQFLETGAVYAPYVPLIMTPLIYDPVNFVPRKGVMTRYAKKVVRPEFFGKITVSHLNYV